MRIRALTILLLGLLLMTPSAFAQEKKKPAASARSALLKPAPRTYQFAQHELKWLLGPNRAPAVTPKPAVAQTKKKVVPYVTVNDLPPSGETFTTNPPSSETIGGIDLDDEHTPRSSWGTSWGE